MALLDVRDLKIAFYDTTPPTEVVKGISFSLEEGETLGIATREVAPRRKQPRN